ncbi:MAG TPA: SDR family NAD(P)-dependent oxidoreductase [Solirubrobacteraceae bacterium]
MSRAHRDSAGKRIVVLGGTSEIALAIVGELNAREPREVALVGRNPDALALAAGYLTEDGCTRALTFKLDAHDLDRHEQVIGEAFEELGGADIVILTVGVLGERGGLPEDTAAALDLLHVNLVGSGSLLIHSARRLRQQGSGTLVVLSSIAAERPRAANVVYGASKAGLDALAQGLGDALREDGVRVLVVRPGFVHTRMTKGLDPSPLSSSPSEVARVAVDGLDRRSHTVWAPPALRWVMLALRLLPRPLFQRLKQ